MQNKKERKENNGKDKSIVTASPNMWAPIKSWIHFGAAREDLCADPKERQLDFIAVAGRLSVKKAITILRQDHWTSIGWAQAVIRLANPESLEDWIPFNKEYLKALEWKTLTTAKMFNRSLEKLMSPKGWKIVERRTTKDKPVFCRYFEIPKKESLLRVILDCRYTNTVFDKPPPVRFASIGEIVAAINFFHEPCCLSLDLRHWFFQLPLSSRVRHLFSIKNDNISWLLQTRVWPMGFSWSPIYAQSLANIIVAEAMIRSGIFPNLEGEAKSPPPVLQGRNSNGRIVALAVIWYDNFLVTGANTIIVIWYDNFLVTGANTIIQDQISKNIAKVCKELNIVIKNSDKDLDEGGKAKVEKGVDGILKTRGRTEFLGIQFQKVEQKLWMKHLEENIEKWKELLKWQWMETTARNIASAIGVIVWNWLVHGSQKGEIASILSIASKIGKLCPDRKSWDEQVRLSPEEISAIEEELKKIFKNEAFEYQGKTTPDPNTPCIFLASDAMNSRGAGIRIYEENASILFTRTWQGLERAEHINVKETLAANATIEALLDSNEEIEDIVITIGVDNTCAVFAIENSYFPGDDELSMALLATRKRCLDKNIIIQAIHVPGELQPADETSRNKTLSLNKARRCLQFLQEEKTRLYEMSKGQRPKISSNLLKRKRGEQEEVS